MLLRVSYFLVNRWVANFVEVLVDFMSAVVKLGVNLFGCHVKKDANRVPAVLHLSFEFLTLLGFQVCDLVNDQFKGLEVTGSRCITSAKRCRKCDRGAQLSKKLLRSHD